MGDSSDSVSIDMDTASLSGKDYVIETCSGLVSVSVYGDQDKPALVTYPDLALNHEYVTLHCFFRKIPRVFKDYYFVLKHAHCFFTTFAYIISVLLGMSTCVSHVAALQELLQLGAATISPDDPLLSVDDLADQVAEVLNYFGLEAVMCMGVTAGAYILTLFAMKYRQRVLGLILISPLCNAPSWTEWLYNKVPSLDHLMICLRSSYLIFTLIFNVILIYFQVLSNLLYYYGMCGVVKELLLKRYFSKEARGSAQVLESDAVLACKRLLDERQGLNVWRFLEAINGRQDISDGLRKLLCRSLVFVGENSPFHFESLDMTSGLDRRYSALVEVQACGSMVTQEQPHAMLIPMEYFLTGYRMYRPPKLSASPRSTLSPIFLSPELLTPESMGLKLKPIKTRISLEL
ncbi:hypothetical protein DKX38_028012 [Salix brachista]|uniref:Pollen-specific protein SF21 n=1 Tax=Salix brachista TaxID=2182728 RepID=A0A5N5J6J2_9ROSI|nr:hypothetical protein DKX38_028012 [Salix brachista]